MLNTTTFWCFGVQTKDKDPSWELVNEIAVTELIYDKLFAPRSNNLIGSEVNSFIEKNNVLPLLIDTNYNVLYTLPISFLDADSFPIGDIIVNDLSVPPKITDISNCINIIESIDYDDSNTIIFITNCPSRLRLNSHQENIRSIRVPNVDAVSSPYPTYMLTEIDNDISEAEFIEKYYQGYTITYNISYNKVDLSKFVELNHNNTYLPE